MQFPLLQDPNACIRSYDTLSLPILGSDGCRLQEISEIHLLAWSALGSCHTSGSTTYEAYEPADIFRTSSAPSLCLAFSICSITRKSSMVTLWTHDTYGYATGAAPPIASRAILRCSRFRRWGYQRTSKNLACLLHH
jgi:hypothetical protein